MLKVTKVSKSQEVQHTILGLPSWDVPEMLSGKNVRVTGREAQPVAATQFFRGKATLPNYCSPQLLWTPVFPSFLFISRIERSGLYFSQLLALLLALWQTLPPVLAWCLSLWFGHSYAVHTQRPSVEFSDVIMRKRNSAGIEVPVLVTHQPFHLTTTREAQKFTKVP